MRDIGIFLVNALEIYQAILVIYALSTWFQPRSEWYYRFRLMLKSAADLIIQPIEELFPKLRFFSLLISYFIIEFVKIYLINSLK